MRTSTFRATFFLYCTKGWNQLNDDITKIESIKKFKKVLIKIIRTKVSGIKTAYPFKVKF